MQSLMMRIRLKTALAFSAFFVLFVLISLLYSSDIRVARRLRFGSSEDDRPEGASDIISTGISSISSSNSRPGVSITRRRPLAVNETLFGNAADYPDRRITRAIVLPVISKYSDTTWLEQLPFSKLIAYYDMEDKLRAQNPNKYLPVESNNGYEAYAYLTFIIDNYDALPDRIAFIHGHRESWHQPDMVNILTRARWENVEYSNLRCETFPGCAEPFNLKDKPRDVDRMTAEMWDNVMERYLGFTPKELASPCCAQFIISKEVIHRNPRQMYVDLRQWLHDTQHHSFLTSRVFEFSWHAIFGYPGHYCVRESVCRCKLFGDECDRV